MHKVKQEEIDFLVNWFENASFEEIEEVFNKKRIKAIIMKEKKFDPIIAICISGIVILAIVLLCVCIFM